MYHVKPMVIPIILSLLWSKDKTVNININSPVYKWEMLAQHTFSSHFNLVNVFLFLRHQVCPCEPQVLAHVGQPLLPHLPQLRGLCGRHKSDAIRKRLPSGEYAPPAASTSRCERSPPNLSQQSEMNKCFFKIKKKAWKSCLRLNSLTKLVETQWRKKT